jgi:porin
MLVSDRAKHRGIALLACNARLVSCALAVLASTLANPVGAQEAASAGSYGGPLLDRSTLTGDWGGERDRLAARGIVIAPFVTQFYQGPTAGNTPNKFEYGGKAESFLTIDAAKLGLWDGLSLHVHGEYNFGRTPGAVGGTTLPNNMALYFPDENNGRGALTSVYFTQRFSSDVTLLAGKMNLVDFYSAGQKFNGGRGIDNFQHSAFTAPPSGTLPGAMLGAIGSWKVNPLTFSLWVYDPQEAMLRTGFECPFCDGVSVRGSVDLSSRPFGLPRRDSFAVSTTSQKGIDFTTLPDLGKFPDTPAFRSALIRSLITQNLWSQDSPKDLPPEFQSSPPSEKGDRYYFSYAFEQTLWQNPTNPANAWGLFGQVAFSEGNPNALQWSAFGGVGGASPLSGRADDKFGLGVFYYGYSKELKEHLEPIITLEDEYGAEVFYNIAVTKWFRLTADLQVLVPAVKSQLIASPPGKSMVDDNSTVVVVGLRSQIKF